ncbi:hypothetical protein BDQ17DRAFT_1433948 [Cyathus striatus]|nr:hypothetical protein BDQ17DRAFT_1433948 [Cyathus striatus]
MNFETNGGSSCRRTHIFFSNALVPAKYLLRTANSRAPYGTFYYPSEDLQPRHGSVWDGRTSLDLRTRDDGDGDVDEMTVRMLVNKCQGNEQDVDEEIKGSARGDKGYRTDKDLKPLAVGSTLRGRY